MQSIQESSYGTIPYCVVNDSYHFLLIEMYSRTGGTHWTFPKGHAEAGESPADAAIRETKEEVGIEVLKVDLEAQFTQTYTFQVAGQLVNKTVIYFLVEVSSLIPPTIQPSEIKTAKWCNVSDAQSLLTHDSTRNILNQVSNYLENKD